MVKRRKLVSISDVAKEAGVSLSTVSFALNNPDRVGKQTRQHVLRIAREIGYTRTRQLKKNGVIGLIADDYHNLILGEFYNWVVFAILNELKSRHLSVMIESTGQNPDFFPKMITKNQVDGVLFIGKCSPDLVYVAQQKNIPFVMVGHPLPEVELPTIVPDGRSGVIQAVEHLVKLGHKKIAMLSGGSLLDPIYAERIEAYNFALTKAGLPAKKEYYVEAQGCLPDSGVEATHKLLALKDRPTAIFCANDSLAYRAYQAIAEKGLKIPKDISIVGFDDLIAPGYAQLAKPDLTTIHIDRQQMGKSSVEILLDNIYNPGKSVYRYTLPVKLVIKKSTAAPPLRA